MRIVLIGAGNLATQLGKALVKRSKHEVLQIYSHTVESARTLADQLQVAYTTSIDDVVKDAELYIVALKDAVLSEVIPELVKGRNKKAIFVHTAGSIPSRIWQGYACRYGVFYPLQTFSKQRDVLFSEIPIFIEAVDKTTEEQLNSFASSLLCRKVYTVNSEQRCRLHMAAVFACNFSNYLYTISERILIDSGLPFEVMYPLIDETSAKIHRLSPHLAQTGPAVRYDENVIGKHLKLLADYPEWKKLYELITKNIHHDQLRFNQDKGTRV